MSIILTVGDNPYVFPEQGNNPVNTFWGENVTSWATDVTNTLNNVSNLVAVPETLFTLLDSQSSTPITDLTFDINSVREAIIDFSIIRNTNRDSGRMILSNNGTSWDQSIQYFSGTITDIIFDISGNTVVYTSSTSSGTSNIKFKAQILSIS